MNLSNTTTPSAHPAIISDRYGYVHVFWSEEMGRAPMRSSEHIRNTGNTILYARWDGAVWTQPVDVLLAPGEALAEWPAVSIDADSHLHVVWMAQLTLYYSSALSWQADSARSWAEPVALAYDSDATPWGADITVDASGNLYVVYASRGDEAGVYFLRSTDGGATWHSPVRLSLPLDPPEIGYTTIKITADDSGRLHVVWATTAFADPDQAVYYARSTDKGDTWSVPVQLAYRDPDDFSVGVPYLTCLGESELHLIYVDGPYVGSNGRFHRISPDGGATWREPQQVITEMVGINGYVVPVVDAAGQMHLIVNMRTKTDQVVGIYYARWLGGGWSPVEPVDVSVPTPHFVAVTTRLGNELHIVYTQVEGGEIWHIQGTISSVEQLPSLEPPTRHVATPAPIVVETGPEIHPTIASEDQPAMRSADVMAPTSSSRGRIHPLAPAVGVSFVLVVGVILWMRIRQRRP